MKYIVDSDSLNAIANAIRNKQSTSLLEGIVLYEFPTEFVLRINRFPIVMVLNYLSADCIRLRLISDKGLLLFTDLGVEFRAEQNTGAACISSAKINLSDYSRIYFYYDKLGTNPFCIGVDSLGNSTMLFDGPYVTTSDAKNGVWKSVDVNSLEGEYYIKLRTSVYLYENLIRAIIIV